MPVCVGVIGCMAERLKDQLFERKVVDIVAGPDALRSLPNLINLFTQVLVTLFRACFMCLCSRKFKGYICLDD